MKTLEAPLMVLFGEKGQPTTEIVCIVPIGDGPQKHTVLAWDRSQIAIPDVVVLALENLSILERDTENKLAVLPIVNDCFTAAKWFQDKGIKLATKEFKRRKDVDTGGI